MTCAASAKAASMAGDVRGGNLAREVGAELGMHQVCGAVQRRADLKHRRQRFDVRGDELGGVLREVPALCDDHRDRVAHVADIGIRQRAERSRRSHRAHHRLPHRMQPRVQVSGGEHGDDSGQRPGLLDVDAAELAVCHGAADERRVQHAGHDHVVDVASAPGQQPRVLPAAHRLADVPPRGHGGAGGRAGDLCTCSLAGSSHCGRRLPAAPQSAAAARTRAMMP